MSLDLALDPYPAIMDREARRQVLLADPDIETVEEHRILCRPCQKWLTRNKSYNLWTWKRHKSQEGHLEMVNKSSAVALVGEDAELHRIGTSRRLKTDERRKLLVDDPHVGAVEPRRVFCLPCQRWVALRKHPELPYFFLTWKNHKLGERHIYRSTRYQPSIQESPSASIEPEYIEDSADSRQLSPAQSCSDPDREPVDLPPLKKRYKDSSPHLSYAIPRRPAIPLSRTAGMSTEVSGHVALPNAPETIRRGTGSAQCGENGSHGPGPMETPNLRTK